MEKAQAFYTTLLDKFKQLITDYKLEEETITITGKVLTPEEALGTPDRRDFPLLTGKERLMEADFKGSKGQAYTDQPGSFRGVIADIVSRYPENNFQRAVLVSSINAVCRYLELTDHTIHCKNNQPEECAAEIEKFLLWRFDEHIKIAVIGHQPSIIEKLSEKFTLRNLDLDKDKIGTQRFGVPVEDGIDKLDEVLQWCDVILATGSTIVNSTIVNYLERKPVYFYGTTIAGAAALMNLDRLCFCAG